MEVEGGVGQARFMAAVIIPLLVFLTATLSGVFGMAGGLLLMVALLVALPVPAAMVLHGVSQLVSNGSRAVLLGHHVRFRIVVIYGLGAAVAGGLFLLVALRPAAPVVLTTLGAVVLAASFVPPSPRLVVTSPLVAFVTGVVVTVVHLFAGASGPLLDLVFVRAPLSRQEIVATKAVTQAGSHLLKIGVYLPLLAADDAPSAWLVLSAMVLAVAGARTGTAILNRLSDRAFRRGTLLLVRALALLTLVQGGLSLVGGWLPPTLTSAAATAAGAEHQPEADATEGKDRR